MKRISLLATLVSAGLLCTMAFAASSASASTLCKSVSLPYFDCPVEDTYGVGTEFDFAAVSKVKLTDAYFFEEFSCKGGELDMTVTNAGGAWPKLAETDITNWTFDACTNFEGESPTVLQNGSSYIWWSSAAPTSGDVYINGNVIEFFSPVNGDYCQYKLVGSPTLTAPQPEGPTATRITFTKEVMEPTTKPQVCKGKRYLSGTFSEIFKDVYVQAE